MARNHGPTTEPRIAKAFVRLMLVSAPLLANALTFVGSESMLVPIPIFPLRKRILLPTERIVLNLYEERYLQLAERFLAPDSSRILATVPSTDKPQIIARGSGPIIPLLEPGDVGVVCTVELAEEAMIPTVGGSLRRRIRLECQAKNRIELTQIISRGTSPPEIGLAREDVHHLPYITAKYRSLATETQSKGQTRSSDQEKKLSPTGDGGFESNNHTEGVSGEFLRFKEYLAAKGNSLSRLDRLELLRFGLAGS